MDKNFYIASLLAQNYDDPSSGGGGTFVLVLVVSLIVVGLGTLIFFFSPGCIPFVICGMPKAPVPKRSVEGIPFFEVHDPGYLFDVVGIVRVRPTGHVGPSRFVEDGVNTAGCRGVGSPS